MPLSDRQITREMIEKGLIRNFDPNPDNRGKVSAGLSSFGIDVRVGYKFKVFDPLYRGVIDPKNFDPAICKDVDVGEYSHHHREPWNQCQQCGCHRDRFHKTKCTNPDHIVLPPHGFALADTIETITVPRDCLVLALSKSTLLRCGMYNSTSVLEPEWTGTVTLELSNLTPLPLKVYAGEGVAQLVFFRSDERLDKLIDLVENEHFGDVNHWPLSWPEQMKEVLNASCNKSYADKKGKYMNQSGITLPQVRKENS